MEEQLLERFESIVKSATGLRLRKGDGRELEGYVLSRMRALRLSSLDEYSELVGGATAASRLERKKLVLRFTVGESYFFRDKGQFELLRARILPELIRLRAPQKCLRIWSAGCSSGEEAYSLAMLVEELIPERGSWDVLIAGSDIKEELLLKAQAGLYGEWSLRGMDDDVRRRYFQARGELWELDERIRRMVTFMQGDLLDDDYPSYGGPFHDMDLILCRNVFIYYKRSAVTGIAAKLAGTLREGGYLMTGHGELFSVSCRDLYPRMYPQSMVYQRAAQPYASAVQMPAAPAAIAGTVMARSRSTLYSSGAAAAKESQHRDTPDETERLMAEAQGCLGRGAYRDAAAKADMILGKKPAEYQALYLAGVAYANLGEHDIALSYLRKASSADRFKAQTYQMMAHLALEDGDTETAKDELKRVIYLSPASVAAYLELADLYEADNDAARAARMRSSALEILKSEPADKKVEPYEDTTVKELAAYLERLLDGKK